MHRLYLLLLLMWLLASGGCGLEIRHYYRELELTPLQSTDQELDIVLVRIESDGCVVIRANRTGDILSAYVGESLSGRQGLVVLSSDPSTQTAVLEARWAEYHEGLFYRLSRQPID